MGCRQSADGYEMTWAVNMVAPFLLTSLLLDTITDRIINVSSISAGSHVDWDNLQMEKGFASHSAYSLSKLGVQLFTAELAPRVAARGIVVNTLDPGTVNTNMLGAGWGMCGIPVCSHSRATPASKYLCGPGGDDTFLMVASWAIPGAWTGHRQGLLLG